MIGQPNDATIASDASLQMFERKTQIYESQFESIINRINSLPTYQKPKANFLNG